MSERIIVSGASGLIGSALVRALIARGDEVVRLVRRPAHAGEHSWQPGEPLDPAVLAGARAVVNLNGASIGRLPWTRGYRRVLRDSRILPTRTLATALRELGEEAPHFVSASAVGFYGDRPGERLAEDRGPGAGFLARLCAEWEHEAGQAGPPERVALLRTAPLLHPEGVLKPLMLLTRLGLSGPLGGGRQLWPWISLDDEVRAILHVIDQGLGGPVNLSGPTPATTTEIGRALSRRLHRPYLLPAPRWALRLGLGRDAATGLLLADAWVPPDALADAGFTFRHATAEAAINAALGG